MITNDPWAYRTYPGTRALRNKPEIFPFPKPLTRSSIRARVDKTANANKRVHASWDGERFEHRTENVRLTKIRSVVSVYQSQADSGNKCQIYAWPGVRI